LKLFQRIRINARLNGKLIIKFLENNYLTRENGKAKLRPQKDICIFCNDSANITREHILPRWVFDNDSKAFFQTTINGLGHNYTQAVLPACATCNNNHLSKVEKEILRIFSSNCLPDKFFEGFELNNIICWMELLDFKFQVFSLITRFKVLRGKGEISFLSDYSLSVLDPNIEYSPTKAMSNLRKSLSRMTVKKKKNRLNSLVIFRTSNTNLHFFHKNNDYLFLELPKYRIAVLYFYEQIFENVYAARDAAMHVIKSHY
jgi:hypothetical protein